MFLNKKLINIFLLVIFIVIAFVGHFVIGKAQDKGTFNRLLLKDSFISEPVSLTTLKLEGKSIQFGVPFQSDKSWVNNLDIEVANRSEKNIKSIEVDLVIPSLVEKGLFQLVPFEYNSNVSDFNGTILPNQKVKLKIHKALEDKFFSNVKQFNMEKVFLTVSYVYFDDDTAWHLGLLHKQDSEGVWRPIDNTSSLKNAQSIKKASFTTFSSLITSNNCTHSLVGFTTKQCKCGTETCTLNQDKLVADERRGGSVIQRFLVPCGECDCIIVRAGVCGGIDTN